MRTRRHLPRLLLLATALAAAPACARRGAGASDEISPEAAGERRTAVRVENLSFSDMTIYAVRSGSQKIRIGQAAGNRTTVLEIPRYLVSVPTPLRFIADPIGSNRTPVSDEITVIPGDEVVLHIPPG